MSLFARKVERRTACLQAALLPLLCLGGCSAAHHATRSLHAGAPLLGEERAGANPNGPYLVADRPARLQKRTTQIDVNAAPDCDAANLSLFESGADVDGDRRTVRLNLVNHAAGPCRLSGYPAISLLREDGSLLGNIVIEKIAARRLEASVQPAITPAVASPGSPSPLVLLAPAGQASFEIGWTAATAGTPCDTVGSVAVSAPGSRDLFTVRHTLTVCQGRVTVTAITDAGGGV